MTKNPKVIAGVIGLVIMAGLAIFLVTQMVPTIGRVRWEMSLTPTPVPDAPESVMAVTPEPSLPTAEPVLRNGMTGEAVKNLQSRLYTLGYYTAEIDGQYGPGTREAVYAFQKANDLLADGIAGQETRELLFSPELPVRFLGF